MSPRSRINRRPDPRRVRKHRSYSIAELAELLDVHRNSVRNWIKRGMACLRTSAGLLIHADDVHAYLGKRRAASRSSCPPGTMYCLRCRAPRRPPPELVELLPIEGRPPNLRGLCPECGGFMHRRVGRAGPAAAGFLALVQTAPPEPRR